MPTNQYNYPDHEHFEQTSKIALQQYYKLTKCFCIK